MGKVLVWVWVGFKSNQKTVIITGQFNWHSALGLVLVWGLVWVGS